MTPVVRDCGRVDYARAFTAMRAFTAQRTADTPDELWCLEHPPVYTQGQAGRPEHLLDTGDTPVVQSDRGGQATWHGPGQLVVYLLLDLRRLGLGPRALVTAIEQAVVDTLAGLGIPASARADAPGVYAGDAKVASLGLRIRNGCSYHGLALNIDPDLSAFARINPCGHAGMAVTSLARLGAAAPAETVRDALVAALAARLGYTGAHFVPGLPPALADTP